MTKDEEKATQDDNKYLMYDENQVNDIFAAIVIGIICLIMLAGLFAWEVLSL